jgi:hypothetical protein
MEKHVTLLKFPGRLSGSRQSLTVWRNLVLNMSLPQGTKDNGVTLELTSLDDKE